MGYFTVLISRGEIMGGVKAIVNEGDQVADSQLYPDILKHPHIAPYLQKVAVIKGAAIVSDFRQEKRGLASVERRRCNAKNGQVRFRIDDQKEHDSDRCLSHLERLISRDLSMDLRSLPQPAQLGQGGAPALGGLAAPAR